MSLWLPPSTTPSASAQSNESSSQDDASLNRSSIEFDAPRDAYAPVRRRMVETRVASAGVTDARVLRSIANTLRHEFIPNSQIGRAYYDMALPIGHSQTISSPFIVASMTESLDPQSTDRVLEIGTGSGYQAAVLSPLVAEVYTIEIVRELGKTAADTLGRLGYDNVQCRIGDGFLGWPEAAPFDKIIVTCSPESVPTPLIEQLREGGQMIIPVGQRYQQTLYRMVKTDGQLVRQPLRPTLFVPMTGTAEQTRQQLPDPTNPVIINGDFDATPSGDDDEFVDGWYYGRQVRLAEGPGGQCARFENVTPGLASHLLQGIAIDGRAISSVRLSASCRTEDVVMGPTPDALPMLAISFYDEVRSDLGTTTIGPFRGTRSWRTASRLIQVPPSTREAIVRIGLFGATGVAEFDAVELTPRKTGR